MDQTADYVIAGAGSAGCALGGSGSINGMLFVRGNRKNYDDWAAPSSRRSRSAPARRAVTDGVPQYRS